MTLLLFGGAGVAPQITTTVAPGGLFDVVARAATGQSATLTVQIVDGDSVIVGPILRPVSETPATGGQADYLFRVTAPTILGGYTVEVVGGDGATDTQPLAVAGYRPTLQDVAALTATRTEGTLTFQTNGWPPSGAVETLIDLAVEAVRSELPNSFDYDDASYMPRVRNIAALHAAILLESSFFREQFEQGSAAALQRLYTTGILALNQPQSPGYTVYLA